MLIGALLTMRGASQQQMLDNFYGSLAGTGFDGVASQDAVGLLQRGVSDRGFAQARNKLAWSALATLNTWLVDLADTLGLVPRWHGMRLVAADASVLMPAVRPCLTVRRQADPNQRLFSLYLPGAELTLHAAVYGEDVAERQMLFEALECLKPGDVLVLDRGYPAAWLVAYLNENGIRFVIRCDMAGGGWAATRAFMRSDAVDEQVTLSKPTRQDCEDYGCAAVAPQVRLVKCISPDGKIRVVATNLTAQQVPTEEFSPLYHQRWRIEEAFKRLKHRSKLESVSGLTQHALLVDVHAKVLADNLASLVCAAAAQQNLSGEDLSESGVERVCNRSYAAAYLQRLLPRLVLGLVDMLQGLQRAFADLVANTHRRVQDRRSKRPKYHVKPHPSQAYKG